MIIHRFTIELEASDPVSVAAPELALAKQGPDLPVAQDAWGQPYIPASSAVGALRSHAKRIRPDSYTALFGSVFGEDDDNLQPSRLRFLGTEVSSARTVLTRQTAINRYTGSAADHSLRTREALSAGTGITIYATAEDLTEAELNDLRAILTTWRPVLGGARTVGLGRANVTSIGVRRFDLSTADGMQAWLTANGPAGFGSHDQKWDPAEPAAPHAMYQFVVTSDIFVGAGSREDRVARPVRSGDDYVIPGSSWKGLFRSRAEFILRSLGLPTCDSTGASTCSRPDCLTCHLFGYSRQSEPTGPTGARGKLTFHTSIIKAVTTAQRTHVAIDRFSGGARRGQLFTQEVVCGGNLEVCIDVPDDVKWAGPLLDWIAWDIHEGFLGVGHGTTRGMGWMNLSPDDVGKVQPRLKNLEHALSGRPAGGGHD